MFLYQYIYLDFTPLIIYIFCRKADLLKYTTKKLSTLQCDDNDPEQQRRDRERVLELMLSKDQVVSLIYAKSAMTAVPNMPVSPIKTSSTAGYNTTSSPTTAAGMEGVVNGLLDMNFSSTSVWNNNNNSNNGSSGGGNEGVSSGGEGKVENVPEKLPSIPTSAMRKY